ncbi:MAG: competence/damage-inducible protein A [Clostridiales Family XIII bacterium]|jgi:nicotinamide-nucleotide amidase|nr:competence/damage-inducible protein A [Clostridiales Family XIII bacterium]
MPSATIIAVGTELLFGQVVNTNAAYLSRHLRDLGVSVPYHHVVGDNPGRFRALLDEALAQTDIVITTGGLGPTQDDLTKEIIAEAFGAPLEYDDEAKQRLDEIMRGFGAKNYTENNLKQAKLPASATIFYNDAGTAPGFAIEKDGKVAIALPGPPREMKAMWQKGALPYLAKLADAVIYSKILRFYGIGESALETALLPIIDGQTDPTVATYAKEGECAVRIASMRKTQPEAEAAVAAAARRAKELAGQHLYSEDDKDYPEVVVDLLRAKGLRLAAAESCTGGLFAGAITSVPGSSDVFDRSFVTYSNKSKLDLLRVSPETLAREGAVSEQCAREMAAGALAHSDADIAVSVTGIAGPTGATCDKPVGTVHFAIATKDGVEAYERHFRDRGRQVNRSVCVLELCDIIRKKLLL